MSLIFSCDRKDLTGALTRAAQGLPSRPEMPVYAGLLFEGNRDTLEVTASDGDVTFIATTDAEIHTKGQVIIPRTVIEASKYFTSDTVAFESDGITAKIFAGRSSFSLPAVDGSKYPAWPQPPVAGLEMDADEFRHAVRRVAPASGDEQLSVVQISTGDKLSFGATNHWSLAHLGIDFKLLGDCPSAGALVPVTVLERLARQAQGTVRLGWTTNLISLQTEGLQVISKLMSVPFPKNWQSVIAMDPGPWVNASTADLTKAVKMASVMTGTDIEGRLKFSFDQADLSVTAMGQDGGSCDGYVETDYKGDLQEFLLGTKVVLDGLAGCEDNVQMSFSQMPLRFLLKSGGLRWLMQPRREIKEENG